MTTVLPGSCEMKAPIPVGYLVGPTGFFETKVFFARNGFYLVREAIHVNGGMNGLALKQFIKTLRMNTAELILNGVTVELDDRVWLFMVRKI